jgi:cobalamin biosynthesis protein CobD/CbiB
MSDIDGLIERLNEEGLGYGIGPALLCQEAASELTRLRGEVERLEAAGIALAMAAGKLNVALDGQEQYRPLRKAVLDTMEAFSATLQDAR